jgi:Zn-dependent peptidase ImmA (M78 family)/transcriptional regulator with XRE-family HTH domain
MNMAAPISNAVGARIRELREGNGITQSELARRLGRTQAALSLWESGRRSPALEDLFAVAEALGVDAANLLRGRSDRRSVHALFRAEASRLLRDSVVKAMEPFVERAEAQKPLATQFRVDTSDPVRAARALIDKSGVDEPPVDVYEIARGCGVQVLRWEFDESISGLLLDFDGRAVIGVNKNHAVVRRRFTVAHELGHYLLEHGERFHLDLTTSASWHGDPPGYDPNVERAANVFAAELLMPAPWVIADSRNQDSVAALARRFGVSHEAMGFRLVNLGLR